MKQSKFSLRLKELRKEKGLTQKQIAEILHCRQATISAWEVGINEPTLQDIIELCNILECSSDYLLGIKDFD